MEELKCNRVPQTEDYSEQLNTPTTHKKTSGAVTVDSYGERSHWRRNSRRRCKTMGLLKKGFQYCLCNILTEGIDQQIIQYTENWLNS